MANSEKENQDGPSETIQARARRLAAEDRAAKQKNPPRILDRWLVLVYKESKANDRSPKIVEKTRTTLGVHSLFIGKLREGDQTDIWLRQQRKLGVKVVEEFR